MRLSFVDVMLLTLLFLNVMFFFFIKIESTEVARLWKTWAYLVICVAGPNLPKP